MSFWGLSRSGKDMRGMMNEIPRWQFDQFKRLAGNGNDLYDAAGQLRPEYLNLLRQQIDQGFGTPGDIRGLGKQVMPGVEDAISRRWGRLGQIGNQWNKTTKAGQTMGDINNAMNRYQGDILRTGGQNAGDINSTYNRMFGRVGKSSGKLTDLITNTYGRERGSANDAYGGLLDQGKGTYGGLGGSLEGTYGEALKNIDKTDPSGSFAAARAGRAFAPMMRNAMERLRRSGGTPNSVEGANMLRGVEASRARSMDDQMAAGMGRFADRKNSALLGRQAGRERLGLGQLNYNTGLTTDVNAINRALGLAQGNAYADTIKNDRNLRMGLDEQLLQNNLGNRNQMFGRSADFWNKKMNNALLNRDMQLQDFSTGSNLQREKNAEDLNNLDLRNTQFGRGAWLQGLNLNRRDTGTGNMGNLMGNLYNTGLRQTNAAGGYANDALRGAQNSYGLEQQNSGWGKQLAGAGAAFAMNLIAPGSGNVLNGMMQGGRQQGYGGFGTPNFNPNANPYPWQQQAPRSNAGQWLFGNPFGGGRP